MVDNGALKLISNELATFRAQARIHKGNGSVMVTIPQKIKRQLKLHPGNVIRVVIILGKKNLEPRQIIYLRDKLVVGKFNYKLKTYRNRASGIIVIPKPIATNLNIEDGDDLVVMVKVVSRGEDRVELWRKNAFNTGFKVIYSKLPFADSIWRYINTEAMLENIDESELKEPLDEDLLFRELLIKFFD